MYPKFEKLISVIAVMLLSSAVFSQDRRDESINKMGFQWGFSLKAMIEFSIKPQAQRTAFRLCADFGVASSYLSKAIYPSINEEIQIYNGGFGSKRRPGAEKPPFTVDFITAFTFTAGFNNRFTSHRITPEIIYDRNKPLYYFADFVNPALQNPYYYSLSVGTNIIGTTDKDKTIQRVGFLNLHFSSVQFSYYNDGGSPANQLHMGDGKDRYYTGGAVVSYNGPLHDAINHIELSFHKFTGYTKNAFEISNDLNLGYVDYYNSNQKYYNKSMWSLNIANPAKGFGVTLKRYNYTKWDVQHLIHWSTFNSYHLVPYEDYFAIGGSYYSGYTNIGVHE